MHVFIKALQISDGVAFRGASRLCTCLSLLAQKWKTALLLLMPGPRVISSFSYCLHLHELRVHAHGGSESTHYGADVFT